MRTEKGLTDAEIVEVNIQTLEKLIEVIPVLDKSLQQMSGLSVQINNMTYVWSTAIYGLLLFKTIADDEMNGFLTAKINKDGSKWFMYDDTAIPTGLKSGTKKFSMKPDQEDVKRFKDHVNSNLSHAPTFKEMVNTYGEAMHNLAHTKSMDSKYEVMSVFHKEVPIKFPTENAPVKIPFNKEKHMKALTELINEPDEIIVKSKSTSKGIPNEIKAMLHSIPARPAKKTKDPVSGVITYTDPKTIEEWDQKYGKYKKYMK